MRLSELQLKTLKRYWKFHTDNYSSSVLYVANTKTWFIGLGGAALGYWITLQPRFTGWGWFLIGYFVAMVVINFELIRRLSRIWPLLEEIINWDRVKELLDAHEPRLPSAPKDQA